MALPDSFLNEIRMRNDITEVISSYVNLKRNGRNMVGLCPFHSERTPSFTVYTATDSFYCFGCGAGGEVITFIRRIENLDYMDAVKYLAQRAGLEMPQTGYDDGMSKLRRRLFEANREAARFFNKILYTDEGAQALNYLKSRELKNSTINRFGLGYSPDSGYALVDHLRSLGFTENEIVQANLGVRSQKNNKIYDKFRGRVIYPLIDVRGNVVAFGGRIMDKSSDKAKYVNTSDTPVFKKSNNIFALNFAKDSDTRSLILAEGYMDVIALHQAGFTNAIATMGTAFTQEQANVIRRYADEVVVCFDSDGAGRKATGRAIEILRSTGIPIRILTVPGNKDPDEFLRAHGENGPAKFKLLLEGSGNDVEYRLGVIKASLDINTSEGKVEYITQASKLLAGIDSLVECEIYVNKLSAELEISKEALMQQINKHRKTQFKKERTRALRKIQNETAGIGDKVNREKASNLRAANSEEALISYLMKNHDKAKYINSRIKADDFLTDFNKRLFDLIMQRIISGAETSYSDIAGRFSLEENGQISRIINTVCDGLEAAEFHIDSILSQKERQKARSSDASDEDISKYLETLRKAKKAGKEN